MSEQSTAAKPEAGAAAGAPAPGGPGRRRMSARASQRWSRLIIELFGVASFYAIVVIYFSARVPDFLSSANIQTILAGATVLGIVAIGQTFAIVSAGFDLSVGGMVPLGAVVYGKLLNSGALLPALILTVLIGAAVGLINGIIVARLKVNALIGTLAMLSVTGGVAFIISNGETLPLSSPHASLWGDTWLLGLQNGTLAFIVLAIGATLVLRYTTYGRAIYTIGGNREAAQLAGLNADGLSMSVYVLSGAFAAFAGAVAASQLLASSPTLGTDTTLNSIAAVVLGGASLMGGVGGVPGTVLGVLLLGTTNVGLGLLQVASYYQTIVTGLVLLVAVVFGRVRELLVARSARLHAD